MRLPWAVGVAARGKLTCRHTATSAATPLLQSAAASAAGECNGQINSRRHPSTAFRGPFPTTCAGRRLFLQQHQHRQLLLLRLICLSRGCSVAAHSGRSSSSSSISSSRLGCVPALDNRFTADRPGARPICSVFSGLDVGLCRILYKQGHEHQGLLHHQQLGHVYGLQVRGISTKRRRYFKMRKFHKKKYKKKLLRAKKIPFVEINRPRRTWKTLHEMQLIRKQFRRGIPGKGARMLRLKRQR